VSRRDFACNRRRARGMNSQYPCRTQLRELVPRQYIIASAGVAGRMAGPAYAMASVRHLLLTAFEAAAGILGIHESLVSPAVVIGESLRSGPAQLAFHLWTELSRLCLYSALNCVHSCRVLYGAMLPRFPHAVDCAWRNILPGAVGRVCFHPTILGGC